MKPRVRLVRGRSWRIREPRYPFAALVFLPCEGIGYRRIGSIETRRWYLVQAVSVEKLASAVGEVVEYMNAAA
jgi:hypothetical protein